LVGHHKISTLSIPIIEDLYLYFKTISVLLNIDD
jgi:hypothetical protein